MEWKKCKVVPTNLVFDMYVSDGRLTSGLPKWSFHV
jgi:hypothetical protein